MMGLTLSLKSITVVLFFEHLCAQRKQTTHVKHAQKCLVGTTEVTGTTLSSLLTKFKVFKEPNDFNETHRTSVTSYNSHTRFHTTLKPDSGSIFG